MPVRWKTYGLGMMFLLLASCTSINTSRMSVNTAGESSFLRWRATDLRHYTEALEEREVYKYTLILENAQAVAITFTHIKAEIWNSHQSTGVDWEKTSQWVLPPHGTLDIPLGSYRYCASATCQDWGSFSPVWNITLTGTTETGHFIQEHINLHLPYLQQTSRTFSANRVQVASRMLTPRTKDL